MVFFPFRFSDKDSCLQNLKNRAAAYKDGLSRLLYEDEELRDIHKIVCFSGKLNRHHSSDYDCFIKANIKVFSLSLPCVLGRLSEALQAEIKEINRKRAQNRK